LRIDSHVLYSAEHPPEHLTDILGRNKFDGAILFAGQPVKNACILGTVVPVEDCRGEMDACGVSIKLGRALELTGTDLPVDVDMHPGQFDLLARLAADNPSRHFAIGRMARPPLEEKPSGDWLHGMEQAAALKNVFCKVSGLLSQSKSPWSAAAMRPYVQHVLALFGSERVMFGSAWPECLPAAIWKETLAAFTQSIGAQTMEVREQLLGLTAERFYGLSIPDAA
jgi:hypothetical protein